MYIKKPHEIELILEGGRFMGGILEKLAQMIKPGVSAAEVDDRAERLILEAGGRPAFKGYRTKPKDPPFPGTVCFSVNEELVHGIAREDKVVKAGDIVSLDIGMEYPNFRLQSAPISPTGRGQSGTSDLGLQFPARQSRGKNKKLDARLQAQKSGRGFFTDTALTIAVGEVPEKTKKLLEVTRQALEVGIAAAQTGRTVADIGRAIEQFVHRQGNYGIVRDLVGHGVGHAVHEEPKVPNYYDERLEIWRLEPGVVIAIEPMITLGGAAVRVARDGWTISTTDKNLNAHFEHTIIITANGPVVATRRPGESKNLTPKS